MADPKVQELFDIIQDWMRSLRDGTATDCKENSTWKIVERKKSLLVQNKVDGKFHNYTIANSNYLTKSRVEFFAISVSFVL